MTTGTLAPDRPSWFVERLATPTRLWIAAAMLVTLALVVGVAALAAALTRSHATRAVATQTEPLLLAADGLYASLSDADATAATTYLKGGSEPVAWRRRYLRDLRTASSDLTSLAHEVGGSPQASAAVASIARDLPVYSGVIETARADNRQGLPIGAAYLRQASGQMRQNLLPAAGSLYDVEARSLASDSRSATSTGTLLAVALTCGAALIALIAIQVYLARLTGRVVNLPLVGATVALLALLAWAIVAFSAEQSALSSAQRRGSDPVQVLSAARILALRQQADESLALVARGGGADNLADFTAVDLALRRLVPTARSLSAETGSAGAFSDFVGWYGKYLGIHTQLVTLETEGNFDRAVRLHEREDVIADRLNADLLNEAQTAQARFVRSSSDARSSLTGLWIGLPLLACVVAVLSLVGLLARLREYR
jgi:hypothetical protein